MPAFKDHLPLATVTIVLSIALFILFKEVRALKLNALQQPPIAYIPSLPPYPSSSPAPGEAQPEIHEGDAEEDPLPPPVTKLPSKNKAKA